MSKILTIDQGTTSSRSIIFDQNANIQDVAQEEYPLLFPNDGWVEIEPKYIIDSVKNTLNKLDLSDIEYAGITNQRETTIVWDRETHEPIYNAIVWQDRRTSQYCESINTQENNQLVKEKTGLLIDSYFSATKIKWILDNVEGARKKQMRVNCALELLIHFLCTNYQREIFIKLILQMLLEQCSSILIH